MKTDDDDGWRDYAACADVGPDLFFSEHPCRTRKAKEICAGCQVRRPCLAYALEQGERWGVAGGLTVRERDGLRWDGQSTN